MEVKLLLICIRLGETFPWAFYWWNCLTGVSYIDFGRFQPRDRWYNPCYIAPKRTASSQLMLAVNFALGAGEGVGWWVVCQKPNLITQN